MENRSALPPLRNMFRGRTFVALTFAALLTFRCDALKNPSERQVGGRNDDFTQYISSSRSVAEESLFPTKSPTQPQEQIQALIPEQDSSNQPKPKKSAGFFHFHFKIIESLLLPFLSFLFTDPDIIRLSSKLCAGTLWLFTILSALGTLGVDTKPFLSLLSISGLTLGFSAKELLANTFVGLFIVLTKPFKRGAIISVGGYRGVVQSIDIRYVKLRAMNESSEILVPLSIVYSTPIIIEKE